MKIDQILVCGCHRPAAVDRDRLQFSWRLSSGRNGCRQSAWHIRVTEEATGRLMWDSGKVPDGRSTGIPYAGIPQQPATRYHVLLRVWDENGRPTRSVSTTYGIGLEHDDWQAQYIWRPDESPNSFVLFRKRFELPCGAEQATVYLFAHNDAQLLINGQHVLAGPARSDPYAYGQYTALDVTGHLQEGANELRVLAHWHGVWSDSGVNAHPCLRMELHIRCSDGHTHRIVTDDSWQWRPTPYAEEEPVWFGRYGGERNRASIRFDARRCIADDDGWQPVVCVDRSAFRLFTQAAALEKERLAIKPVSFRKCREDSWLIEFPYCLTGWPQISFPQTVRGQEIRIQYWEVQPDWGDAGYDTYICSGQNDVFYAPFVRHTSFRYLEITGYPGILFKGNITGWLSSSEEKRTGSFACSDERMNRIWDMCTRSAWQNVQQGIISVDANREQSPWTADSWHIGMGILYNHRDTRLIDKIVRDYAAEQQLDGNLLCCSPAREFVVTLQEWSLYWPMLLWEQYMFSGDELLLRAMYPVLKRLLAYFENTKQPSGLCDPPGWRASDYAGGSIANGGENVVTNCHLHMVLKFAVRIAAEVCPDEQVVWQIRADELKDAINRCLLTPEGCYKTRPDMTEIHPLGTLWAVRAGVIPEAVRPQSIRWLSECAAQGIHVGGYGGDTLYTGLYEADLGHCAALDYARYDQMLRTNHTNWESFGELSQDNMGNHAWTAYPAYLMPRYVGGIRPLQPGFAAVEMRPVTGGLAWARCTVPTVRGDVSSEWKLSGDGRFRLTVSIPVNTEAHICLPQTERPVIVGSGIHTFEKMLKEELD